MLQGDRRKKILSVASNASEGWNGRMGDGASSLKRSYTSRMAAFVWARGRCAAARRRGEERCDAFFLAEDRTPSTMRCGDGTLTLPER